MKHSAWRWSLLLASFLELLRGQRAQRWRMMHGESENTLHQWTFLPSLPFGFGRGKAVVWPGDILPHLPSS